MTCFLKHKWNGCKCTRCGKIRDEQHDWDGCKCKRCNKTRDTQHDWDGCRCIRCGKLNDLYHDWDGCKCKRCGSVRDTLHDWDDSNKCKRCGKNKPDYSSDSDFDFGYSLDSDPQYDRNGYDENGNYSEEHDDYYNVS